MINLSKTNFNINFDCKLYPKDTTNINFSDLEKDIDYLLTTFSVSFVSVNNSEPYKNIEHMAIDFYDNNHKLQISNLFHPPYARNELNLKLRALHDYCHVIAFKNYPDVCPKDFNTISECLAYVKFEQLCELLPNHNLKNYNRYDFVAQTIIYDRYNTFMNKQFLMLSPDLILDGNNQITFHL